VLPDLRRDEDARRPREIAKSRLIIYFTIMKKTQIADAVKLGKPFIVEDYKGRRFDVPDEDYIWLVPTGEQIMIHTADEASHLLDCKQVAKIEFPEKDPVS
jgi:hypothetical protein